VCICWKNKGLNTIDMYGATMKTVGPTFKNTEVLCITHAVEHNFISPSRTVGIQLHVSAL